MFTLGHIALGLGVRCRSRIWSRKTDPSLRLSRSEKLNFSCCRFCRIPVMGCGLPVSHAEADLQALANPTNLMQKGSAEASGTGKLLVFLGGREMEVWNWHQDVCQWVKLGLRPQLPPFCGVSRSRGRLKPAIDLPAGKGRGRPKALFMLKGSFVDTKTHGDKNWDSLGFLHCCDSLRNPFGWGLFCAVFWRGRWACESTGLWPTQGSCGSTTRSRVYWVSTVTCCKTLSPCYGAGQCDHITLRGDLNAQLKSCRVGLVRGGWRIFDTYGERNLGFSLHHKNKIRDDLWQKCPVIPVRIPFEDKNKANVESASRKEQVWNCWIPSKKLIFLHLCNFGDSRWFLRILLKSLHVLSSSLPFILQ